VEFSPGAARRAAADGAVSHGASLRSGGAGDEGGALAASGRRRGVSGW